MTTKAQHRPNEDVPASIYFPMLRCPNYPDFPTAWAIQHDRGTTLEHHPSCSSSPQWAMLCDCGAVENEWHRLKNLLDTRAAFAAGRRFESATEGLSDETFEVTK